MSTPDERVEVTPELLDGMVHVANAVLAGEPFASPMFRNVVTAPRVLALVQRIRELELRLEIAQDAFAAETKGDPWKGRT